MNLLRPERERLPSHKQVPNEGTKHRSQTSDIELYQQFLQGSNECRTRELRATVIQPTDEDDKDNELHLPSHKDGKPEEPPRSNHIPKLNVLGTQWYICTLPNGLKSYNISARPRKNHRGCSQSNGVGFAGRSALKGG